MMISLINHPFYNKKQLLGPFVYRLGHVVFILERGVRFPQGPPIMNYFVYLLINSNREKNTTYVGYTNDIKKRLKLHNSSKGAKFTRGRKWQIIYKKKYKSKSSAMKNEYKLKKDTKFRNKIKQKFLKKKN